MPQVVVAYEKWENGGQKEQEWRRHIPIFFGNSEIRKGWFGRSKYSGSTYIYIPPNKKIFEHTCTFSAIEPMTNIKKIKTTPSEFPNFRKKAEKSPCVETSLWLLAVRTRLELVTPCVTGMYSNQLN